MKHLKRFNENSDEEDYNKYLEHKKSMTKTLTEEEFNNIAGSPYANELFITGNIYKNDKEEILDFK